MRRRLGDGVLALLAAAAAVGVVRSVLVQTPAAADLPVALRRSGVVLSGHVTTAEAPQPAWQGGARSEGPSHRYRLVPQAGGPALELELVVTRSGHWEDMAPEPLKDMRWLRLSPTQQIALGRLDGKPALQTCLVGRGAGDREPVAAGDGGLLAEAVNRWRDRLEPSVERIERLKRGLAIQAGMRVSERWECLRVRLVLEATGDGAADQKRDDAALMDAWRQLAPQLRGWGETWDGVTY